MQPNRLSLLKAAEYTSLAASIVGVVISTASRQVVYAAAPLSVSLFLNLINRQRFEQQTQQSLTATMAQVDRQLSQLNQAFSHLQQEVTSSLSQQLSELDARVTSEQQVRLDLSSAIAQVEERLSQLTQSVSDDIQSVRQQIQSQASVLNPAALQVIQQGLSELQNRINSIESLNLGALPQNIAQLQGQYDSLLASTSSIDQRLDNFPSIERVDSLKTEVDQLQVDMSQLQTDLEQQQNNQQATLEQLQTEIQAQFRERFAQLAQSISAISQQIQSQEPASNSATLEIVQQEISQLQNRLASVESLNLRSVLQNIAQLQSQYNSLLESASRMGQRLDSLPSTERANSLKTEIDQLQVNLSQLQTAVQQQQDNLQAELAQLQTELQALLALITAKDADSTTETIPSDTGDDTGGDEEDAEPELELLDLNLGIDFGTSFTKVCFRDIARDRSEIVTFTDGQADLDEALLPTKIGILPDGTLLAGLTKGEWAAYEQPIQTSVEFIKMRLADLDLSQNSDGWRLEHLPELERPETVENLCAYYLSRVIARAQSWIRRNKSELVENQKIEWVANVGVPVEYCDSPAIARFEKVLSLAWLLSNEPQTELFTLSRLGDRLKELRLLIANNPIDCHAIPEISAAVWSFLNSREAREGFYTFFDVGDGTLDGVSFRYWREDDEPKVDFYSALVKPLGVSAISQRLAVELNAPQTEVRSVIFNQSDSRLAAINSSQSQRQIQQLVGTVVMDGRENHGNHRPLVQKFEFQRGLSVFIGGGGGQTDFYKKAIMSTHADFNHKSAGIPAYIQKDVPTPRDLSMSGLNSKEFHRFAVAYGLSIPKENCPDIRLPSEMAKAEPQQLKTTSGSAPIRYEDSRDSC